MRRTTITTALAVTACLAPAAAARADTASFGYTGGEQAFTVPAGVSSIQVVAVGGRGGRGGSYQGGPATVPGGFGARVTATLAVTPGQVYYVEVGGNGAAGNGPFYSAGGFNGGGDGGPTANGLTGAGAGGGATDLRTVPRNAGNTLNSRVLIAAGGGGGGAGEGGGPGEGVGGAAGADGGDGDKFGQICEGGGGGQAAGGLFPGAAGTHSNEVDATPAPTAGAFGVGGKGGSNGSNDGEAGGGGGGGRAGGGGGGASTADSTDCDGGGGGGGSSLFPTGGSVVTATSATPRVEITYTVTPTGGGTGGGGTGGGGTGGGGTGGGGTGGGGTGGGGTGGGGTGGGGTTADPLGPLAVKRIQRGTAVKGSTTIGFANSSFKAELYGNSPRYGTYPRVARRVLLGRVTKTVTSAGKYAFTVKLNKRGRRALKRRGKLKLVLRVAVTPQGGGTEVAKKNMTLLKPRS